MSMIERVAKAICRANCPPSMTDEAIDLQTECAWDMWVPEARAAIETLRHPSATMIGAGGVAIDSSFLDMDDADLVSLTWEAMIKAALSGPHINSIMGEGK